MRKSRPGHFKIRSQPRRFDPFGRTNHNNVEPILISHLEGSTPDGLNLKYPPPRRVRPRKKKTDHVTLAKTSGKHVNPRTFPLRITVRNPAFFPSPVTFFTKRVSIQASLAVRLSYKRRLVWSGFDQRIRRRIEVKPE